MMRALRRVLLALALLVAQPLAAEPVELTLDQARIVARQAYAAGEYGVANALARRLLEADAQDAQALLILAATEPALGNPAAGRRAGRAAWAAAGDAPVLRYEIARHTSVAAFREGRPGLAQFWLRRAADMAPTPAHYAQTVADYRRVQARNPVRLGFDLAVAPTSNLNGAGQGGVLEIDGQVLDGFYNRSLPPLSGVRAEAQARLSYRLAASERGQTTLGAQVYGSLNMLSEEARALNLDVSGSEFNQLTAEGSLTRDFLWPGTRHPVQLGLTAGQNWTGGEVLGPHLRLGGSTSLLSRDRAEIRLASSVERQWQDQGPVDTLSLALMGRRLDAAGGEWGAGIYLREVQGAAVNQDFRDLSGMISYALPRPVGPVALSARLTAGLRDYDIYRLGFVQVTDGRHDQRLGLSLDMTFHQVSLWGHSPKASISGTQTLSNVSWFESRQMGLSLGFESRF
ncbi:hypothetical protein RNZ50_04545 [Paracoccaceae bacterium Fryx2]|nr:hypothetical protein [Paracoccaceae bacterium Fryx2]